MSNYGYIPSEVVEEDFVFGSAHSLGKKYLYEPLVPDGDWRPTLFDGIQSHQAPGYETFSCVAHAILNAFELLYKKQYGRTYDFSDRFLAKISDTDPAKGGNTPKKVAHTFYKMFDVLEREWATKDAKTTDEFYAEVPEKLKTLATCRGAEWSVGYEYVNSSELKNALRYSPIGISVPAWTEKNGKYYRPEGMKDNHFTCLIAIDDEGYHVLDSYPPFNKVLRSDIKPTFTQRYYLKKQVVDENAFNTFLTWLSRVFWGV